MSSLPSDVFRLILQRLSYKECARVSSVCKLWNQIAKNCQESICISRDVAFWPSLKLIHLKHLAQHSGGVRNLEVLDDALRERSFYRNANVEIRGLVDFFPPGTIAESDLPQNHKDRYSAEESIRKRVKEEVHQYLREISKHFPKLESIDMRGLAPGYNDDNEQGAILFGLLPIAHQITSLKLEPTWRSSVFPSQLHMFSNLTQLTFGYPGLRDRYRQDNKQLPDEILSLHKLKKLEFCAQVTSCENINLQHLTKLEALTIGVGQGAKFKDIKLPKSVRRVHILDGSNNSEADLSSLCAAGIELEQFQMNGSNRVEWRNINDNPNKYPNRFPSAPASWKLALPAVSRLQLVNMGMRDCAIDDHLSSAIGLRGNLQALIAPYNYFERAPFLAHFKTVTDLDLSHNQLSSLPEAFADMKSLKKLRLGVNLLSELPAGFSRLLSLQELDLSENRLTHFPPALLALTMLENLCLDENDVGSPPEKLYVSLTSLRELSMCGCQVEVLSESVSFLRNLRTLQLSYNRIDMLPKSLVNMELLETIDLRFNTLAQIPLPFALCSSIASGPLLQSLKKYLSGELKWPPADIDAFHKAHAAILEQVPLIQLSSQYSAPPEAREGAWYFFNPEKRNVVGHGSFEERTDLDEKEKQSQAQIRSSVWFTVAAEWVYRNEWASYIQNYQRWQDYEFSSAWSSPSEKRDRLSMCQFAGHGAFAGLALASMKKITKAETQDLESAEKKRLEKSLQSLRAEKPPQIEIDSDPTKEQQEMQEKYDRLQKERERRALISYEKALRALEQRAQSDGRHILEAEYRLSGRAQRDQSWNARGHWQTTILKLVLDDNLCPIVIETKRGEQYREPK